MKVTTTPAKQSFQPVTLNITFEDQISLDAFAALFNTSCICDSMSNMKSGIDHELIRNSLEGVGADPSNGKIKPDMWATSIKS